MNDNRQKQPLRILSVGPQPRLDGKIDSYSICLSHLLDYIRTGDAANLHGVDTGRIRGHGLLGAYRLVRTMLHVLVSLPRCDVITLHCSRYAISWFGLFHLIIARLSRTPLIVQVFAGFDYRQTGPIRGRVAHFVVRRSDLYLAETKYLVRLAQERGVQHVKWFPVWVGQPPGLSRHED